MGEVLLFLDFIFHVFYETKKDHRTNNKNTTKWLFFTTKKAIFTRFLLLLLLSFFLINEPLAGIRELNHTAHCKVKWSAEI